MKKRAVRRCVPGVEVCESRIALDGEQVVGTGPLPTVGSAPYDPLLSNPDDPVLMQNSRVDNLDPTLIDLGINPSFSLPTIYPDYPSRTMLFDSLIAPDEEMPNGPDAFVQSQEPL